MKIALKFGQRMPKSSAIRLGLLFLITISTVIFFGYLIPNPFSRTDMDVNKALLNESANGQYVQLDIPQNLAPVQRATIEFRGETQNVDLLQIASKKIDGEVRTLIARRPCSEHGELKELAKTGKLCGDLSWGWEFDQLDQATLTRLYPNLDLDHFHFIDVVSRDHWGLAFIILVYGSSVFTLFFPVGRRIVQSRRNERLWKSEMESIESNNLPTNGIAFDSQFISEKFSLPELSKAPKHKIWSGAIYVCMALNGFFAMMLISIVIRNPLVNIWLTAGTAVVFIAVALMQARLKQLFDSWKPIPKLVEREHFSQTSFGFHKYHKTLLERLGFQTVGLFKRSKQQGLELLLSSDQSIVIELGCETESATIHYCNVVSFLSDSNTVLTSVNELAQELETEDGAFKPQTAMLMAIEEHIESIETRCERSGLTVQTIDKTIAVKSLEYAWQLEKLDSQLETINPTKGMMKYLQIVPDWLRMPLVTPIRNHAKSTPMQ